LPKSLTHKQEKWRAIALTPVAYSLLPLFSPFLKGGEVEFNPEKDASQKDDSEIGLLRAVFYSYPEGETQ